MCTQTTDCSHKGFHPFTLQDCALLHFTILQLAGSCLISMLIYLTLGMHSEFG